MEKTLDFPDLLRLIDERSTAFRDAVAAAPGLDVQVPTCPGWTLFDLVRHLGEGRRKWAGIVTAGPADAPPAPAAVQDADAVPRELGALLDWWEASARQLLDALRESGPDRGCWTWWEGSQSPRNAGAVARHQLQEIAVHTYDAQIASGSPQPLPEEVALDGVDEFLSTCCATPSAWPHRPASVDYLATEGRSWRLTLSADGARADRLPDHDAAPAPADASLRGTAGELVLALYGRVPVDSLKAEGDRHLFDQLLAWDPDQ
ncbi:maleylpyruvate isomerase family mycothiol-dependent enzyme [Streptomyces sp. NPDC003832]